MEMSPCRYRYRVLDGPTRMGSLEMDKKRLGFPILIRQETSDPYRFHVVSGGSEWKDIGLVLEEEGSIIPEPILGSHIDELGRLNAEALSAYVSRSRNRLSILSDGELKDTGCLVLSHVQLLAREPSKLMTAVLKLREKIPMHAPLYLPGVPSFANLEFLVYLGIEVMDTLAFESDAARGLYYTRRSAVDLDKVSALRDVTSFCNCRACRKLNDGAGSGNERYRLLKEHNINNMAKRMAEATLACKRGVLRELVMSSLAGHPEWMTAMKKMENEHFPSIMPTTPTYRNIDQIKVTYREDLASPDHQLWRYRIQKEYAPYHPRPVILLLPCSAGKPYSRSRTHNRITGYLSSIRKWRRYIHRIVLTSPLGTVPMELEDLYPASFYDIPVTGEWTHEEVGMVRGMTSALVKKESPDKVVIFHEQGDIFYPEELHEDIFRGADVTDVWKEAKAKDSDGPLLLKEVVRGSVEEERAAGKEGRDEDLRSLVRFSLGCSVEDLDDLYVRNTRKGRVAFRGRVPLFDLKRGGPVPTKRGGKTIWDLGKAKRGRVVIIDDFVPRGTVFGQGILSIEGVIHPGDIVIVGDGDEFRGVGRALVDGNTMLTNNPGPAVQMISHVRERR
ncbi:MAG: DUF5591 domain-containing protein [Thermoplasmatota archaeon]